MKFEIKKIQFALNMFKKNLEDSLNFERAPCKLQRPIKSQKQWKEREGSENGRSWGRAWSCLWKITRAVRFSGAKVWADQTKHSHLGRPGNTKIVANLKLIRALVPQVKLDLASWQNSNVRLAIWEYRPGNVALRFTNVDMRHCNMVE